MKVVCISNVELSRDSSGKPSHNILHLTIGKVYEAEESDIKNDNKYYLIDEGNNVYDSKLSFPLVWEYNNGRSTGCGLVKMNIIISLSVQNLLCHG